MSTKAEELKLDIEEFNSLLQQANRQRCKDALSLEVRKLQTELAKLEGDNAKSEAQPTNTVSSTLQKCYEVKLNNYGWDQTNTTVKLYVTLKDVHQLPKDAVTCNFMDKSLDLRIFGLDNKNYSLTVNNLCEDIDVNQSTVKVKTDMVVVSMVKKVPGNWSHVTGVEKRIKELKLASTRSATEDTADPGASIMNLLKKMYEEGDDDMKRSIAKVWMENQEKRGKEMMDI